MKVLILTTKVDEVSSILYNLCSHDINVSFAHNIEEAETYLSHDHFDGLLIDFNAPFIGSKLLMFSIETISTYRDLVIIGIGTGTKEVELNYLRSYGIHDYIKNDTDPEITYLRLKNLLKRRY